MNKQQNHKCTSGLWRLFVQGSCPHLFPLLKAVSPQVFTLAFALAYLLAKLCRRLRSCWRFLLFLFFFSLFCMQLSANLADWWCSEKHFRCCCHTWDCRNFSYCFFFFLRLLSRPLAHKENPDSVTCKKQMVINLFLNNVGIKLLSRNLQFLSSGRWYIKLETYFSFLSSLMISKCFFFHPMSSVRNFSLRML